jgi:hypothetical protein
MKCGSFEPIIQGVFCLRYAGLPLHVGKNRPLARFGCLLLLGMALLQWPMNSPCQDHPIKAPAKVTLLCYLNGDNDLAQEVLHTLDMMETIGSSPDVNVVVLVDGHPDWLGPYGNAWSGARLLYLKAHPEIGRITSPAIGEWGEADLGSSDTVKAFVRSALQQFPAQRYMFYAFAHGQGVIDTKSLSHGSPGKALSISRDATSRSKMSLEQFHKAIYSALQGRTFDLMVMFSCLAGMVEVGYSLSDITHYLVASEDEIRLLNQPQGAFQIRGLKVEEMIAALHRDPGIDPEKLGRMLVDSHFQNYQDAAPLWADQPESATTRLAASMALVDCRHLPELAGRIDVLAGWLIAAARDPQIISAIDRALHSSQQFPSFLNLEYYDLADFLKQLLDAAENPEIDGACRAVLRLLQQQVVVYERHTSDRRAGGLSIYLSNPLVPQNIFEAHHAMYRNCRFSRDTRWDEWVGVFRTSWKNNPLGRATSR